MNMIVSHTSLAYVISKTKTKLVDFDVNSDADLVLMSVFLTYWRKG